MIIIAMAETDSLFRAILAAILLPGLAAALYYRLRSHSREKLDRAQEGIPTLISLRLLGLLFWVCLFLWMANPSRFPSTRLALPLEARWFGLGLMAVSFGWISWVFRSLGSNLTDTVVTRQNAYLVTRGPYAWIRHPLYTAVLPMGAAVSLITGNAVFFLITVPVLALLVRRTDKEEAHLLARFPDAYRSYMQRTGRFLPKL